MKGILVMDLTLRELNALREDIDVSKIMEDMGLSKTQLAKAIGVTFVTVDNWCRKKSTPSIENTQALADLVEKGKVL